MRTPSPPLQRATGARLRTISVALALPLVFACDSRPRAPSLQDEPIYQNAREGFRFLAPEGWSVRAKTDVPPGPLAKEHMLVLYRQRGSSAASLEVSMADLPEKTDLAQYLSRGTFGVEKWEQVGQPESVEIGQQPAVRYLFKGGAGRDAMDREVMLVRRGERVYFFTILYPPGNTSGRDQARHAIETTVWRSPGPR